MGFPGQRVSHSLKVKFTQPNVQIQAESLPSGTKRRLTNYRNESSSAHRVVASSRLPDIRKQKGRFEMVVEGGPQGTPQYAYTIIGKPGVSLT